MNIERLFIQGKEPSLKMSKLAVKNRGEIYRRLVKLASFYFLALPRTPV